MSVKLRQALSDQKVRCRMGGRSKQLAQAKTGSAVFTDIHSNSPIFTSSRKKYFKTTRHTKHTKKAKIKTHKPFNNKTIQINPSKSNQKFLSRSQEPESRSQKMRAARITAFTV